MRNRQRSAFTTIISEGALLPADVLLRISQMDTGVGGMSAEDYHCNGEKLNEVISGCLDKLGARLAIFSRGL